MSAQRWLFQDLLKDYGKVDDEDTDEVERFFPHSAGTYVVYDSAAVEAGISISNPCAGMDPCNGACTRTKEAGCQVQRGDNDIHTAVYNFVATVRRQAHVLGSESDDTVKDILASYRPRLNTDDSGDVAVSDPDRQLVDRLTAPGALRNVLYHALDRNRLPNDVDESVRTKRVQYLLGTFQHRLTLNPGGIAAVKKVPNDGDMVFVAPSNLDQSSTAEFDLDVFEDPQESASENTENTGDSLNVGGRV